MQAEIERLKKMLSKEDPRTPNYNDLLYKLREATEIDRRMRMPLTDDTPYGRGLRPIVEIPKGVEEPAAEEPAAEEPAAEEPTTPTKEYTIEEVRAAIKEAQSRGVDARPYIAAYGVKNLSAIPKESYGELIEAVGGANA